MTGIVSNDRRLWRLDRDKFDYPSLPMVLSTVFQPIYRRELLRDSVCRRVEAIDLSRYLLASGSDAAAAGSSEELGAFASVSDYSLVLLFIEDPLTDAMLVAMSDCQEEYRRAWSKMLGVEPLDLFESSGATWDRLFPSGEPLGCQALTWSLLDGDHPDSVRSLAGRDPVATEFMVPHRKVRLTGLVRSLSDLPAEPVDHASVVAVVSQPIAFGELVDSSVLRRL